MAALVARLLPAFSNVQRRPVTIPFRDIQIRDASSREFTENTGIVRLQLLIVALSDGGAGEGVQQA
jgi:hypothetical protein